MEVIYLDEQDCVYVSCLSLQLPFLQKKNTSQQSLSISFFLSPTSLLNQKNDKKLTKKFTNEAPKFNDIYINFE